MKCNGNCINCLNKYNKRCGELNVNRRNPFFKYVICKKLRPLFWVISIVISFSMQTDAILVESGYSAEQLANYIAGENLIISNVNGQMSQQSAGIYTDAYVESGIESLLFDGVVLSSGSVNYLNSNINTSPGKSYQIGFGPDNDLNGLIPAPTYDATYIEFDLIPEVTGVLYFTYMFGSEEYFFDDNPLYEGWTDVMGIFIDGENIAVLLGNDVPVSVKTINEYYNSKYFNENNYDYPMYATEMDGFTDPFTGEYQVIGGQQYHFKFGVTDATDFSYDSWALFGKNSLRVEPVGVDEPGLKSMIAVLIVFIAMVIFIDKKCRILIPKENL